MSIRSVVSTAAALVCLVLLPACTLSDPEAGGPVLAPVGGSVGGSATAALAALAYLPAGAHSTGYSRIRFGEGWGDLDGDGCNTRQEILHRDLEELRIRAGSRGCTVARGTLLDPYTGRVVAFTAGPQTSDEVQIDHVVALAAAWRTGADRWSAQRREHFANDPLELLAVDGQVNQDKGSQDAAAWLPPAPARRCSYVARQIAVKTRYALAVTTRERAAMGAVLSTCPEEMLP